MRHPLKALKSSFYFLILSIAFIACDKDFSVIESEVLGQENANFLTDSLTIPVVAYNKTLDGLQINNLPANLLGVYKDLNHGITTASIVTQITPTAASLSEDFGTNPVIDSVVIKIPYFSTITGVDSENNSIPEYSLDSLYGNNNASIKLSIYQNNYYLNNIDFSGENANSPQNYYSKAENLDDPSHNFALSGSQTIDFDNHLGTLIYEDLDFKNNADPIELWQIKTNDITKTLEAPALRISFESENDDDLDEIAFWQQTIVEKNGEDVLSSINYFRNYFRGLYFKTEALSDDGHMILLNLGSNEANITIYYKKGEDDARTNDNYVLNFTGNRLNTFKNEFTLPEGDKNTGDAILNLKGQEGSMAVIDLFPTQEALNAFKNEFIDEDGNLKKLINEAHLLIYEDTSLINPIDEDTGESLHEHDRIYAYDVNNNTPLIDYLADPIENNISALNSKVISLGQRNELGRYKIRITEHLNNIIQNDSTNYKIGLVLSSNVNVTSNSGVLNPDLDDVTGVPSASIISPRGTILSGTNSSIEHRQLKLKVFFTEPK